MAVPDECEITYPADLARFGAAPDNTATFTVTGTTDPSISVQLLLEDVPEGDPVTSSVAGAFSIPVTLPLGAHDLSALAGTDPDTLESSSITVVVFDVVAAIGSDTAEKSVTWYLNFLAGADVTTNNLLDARTAACTWAGVSPADYSMMGALNVKAGNTDRSLWKRVNTVLNQLAQNAATPGSYPNARAQWLDNQTALYNICVAEQA
jgi:hypothetical protein